MWMPSTRASDVLGVRITSRDGIECPPDALQRGAARCWQQAGGARPAGGAAPRCARPRRCRRCTSAPSPPCRWISTRPGQMMCPRASMRSAPSGMVTWSGCPHGDDAVPIDQAPRRRDEARGGIDRPMTMAFMVDLVRLDQTTAQPGVGPKRNAEGREPPVARPRSVRCPAAAADRADRRWSGAWQRPCRAGDRCRWPHSRAKWCFLRAVKTPSQSTVPSPSALCSLILPSLSATCR